MSDLGDLYLGVAGSELLLSPFGRLFTIGNEEISREGRTASGRLVRDIITTKKVFTLEYSEMETGDLQDLVDLYDLHTTLSFLICRLKTTPIYYDKYNVLMDAIDRRRILSCGSGLWSGVIVKLKEI